MRDPLDGRTLAHMTIPVVVALLVLATMPLWGAWVRVPDASSMAPLLSLALIAAIAAIYVPVGHRTLGLGAAALPPAIWFFGVAWAGWLAGFAYLLRELLRWMFFDEPLREAANVRLLPTVTDAARVSLAAVVGGWVWVGALDGGPGEVGERQFLLWGMAAVAAYLVTLTLLHSVESRWLASTGEWFAREVAQSSPLDLIGWAVGGLVARVVTVAGWTESLLLLVGVAVLAAEAARNVHLRRRAVERVSELWEVTRAGHRIIFRDPDLASMAGHVLEECRNVMPFYWFQFELLDGEEGAQSWSAGPDGHIEQGRPDPADSPPALPGIHRRSSWKVVQRQLLGDGQPIALLRFWCDPRRLESTSVELLDSLLPQVAASLHRALLDRRAKQDPLTGLADRRVLETHLERVFDKTHEEGGSMAVIMCDLDRFKKINDTYGHDVGDRALLEIVKILEKHRRDSDLCSRFGGEEFAVVLERTDGETALRVAERLRIEVQRCQFIVQGAQILLRLSVGVAAYPELHVKAGKELLVLADEALIEAKKQGRNRSLLNLGRRRYRSADGKLMDNEEAASEPEAPTLFA